MEKAILKTLIYANLFNYPLKINEIHRWLIGRKVTLRQLEKALKVSRKYYFLRKREGLVAQRRRKEQQSKHYLRKAKIIAQVLKIIPWVKLVGVSGGLALNNVSKKDDIDLFLIIRKNRLWISRLICLGLLSVIRQRRKVGDKGKNIAGKICLNILLEEDKLEQRNKDIFTAHEVLQMRPLWQRGGIYTKFLEDNAWAFKFLPNWMSTMDFSPRDTRDTRLPRDTFFSHLENLAKWFQLKVMQKPKGLERIEEGALYFHPDDIREEILKKYNQSLTRSANVWYKPVPYAKNDKR